MKADSPRDDSSTIAAVDVAAIVIVTVVRRYCTVTVDDPMIVSTVECVCLARMCARGDYLSLLSLSQSRDSHYQSSGARESMIVA